MVSSRKEVSRKGENEKLGVENRLNSQLQAYYAYSAMAVQASRVDFKGLNVGVFV